MKKTLESLNVLINGLKKQVLLDYLPKTKKAVYDICDLNGRVVISGNIHHKETIINISDLISRQYILLIVDGESVVSKKFDVED